MTKRPGFETRHVSAEDATRLYQAWARLGLAMVERPIGLSRTAVERLAGAAVQGLVGPWAPQRLAQTAGREGLDFATGLMATPAEAAAAAVETLDAPRPPVPDALWNRRKQGTCIRMLRGGKQLLRWCQLDDPP